MPDPEIISVRNLVDTEFGTPLREFKGRLKEYYPEEQRYGTFVILNFIDLEVLRSAEPYNFPIASLSIKLSNRKRSGWGIFGDTLAALLPEDQDIKDCVNRMMHLEMEEGHVYGQDRTTGEDMVGNPWHVLDIEGGAAPGVALTSAKDRATELLIGKTRAEFNKAAYADPIIRKDTALQRAITDKSFINSLLQLGTVMEDENGVFQLAESPAAAEVA